MKKFKELIVNSWALLKRLFHSVKFTFFYYVGIELVEEMLEELIAWELSNLIIFVVSKAFSVTIVFVGTQSIKFVIKKIVKKLTYKEGNDKVSKVKKYLQWIVANKCTLGGIVTGALTVVSGTGLINVDSFPALMIGAFNLTPVLYYGILGILTIICAFFPETIEKFKARIDAKKAEKQEKSIEKEAKKEIAQAQKEATQTQAQKEKADAKAKAEEFAKQEKEKADAEHRAKVEEAKRKLLAQSNNNQNA